MPASGIPAGGAGWGGEARSYADRQPLTAENQPPPEHKSAGHMEAKEYREALKERRAKVLQVYDRVLEKALLADDAPTLMAGARVGQIIDDRIDGKANQPLSGPDGGAIPTALTVSFVRPSAAEPSD
jgi:hypothetical protein